MSAVFKSRKPRTTATRQKGDDEDAAPDEEREGEDSGMSPMLAAKQRKKESARKGEKKGKAKLSFAEDEIEDTAQPFVPRKSTLSQSISLQKLAHANTAAAAAPPPAAVPLAQKSTYNSDYLAQLKASTPTRSTLAREPDVVVPYDEDIDLPSVVSTDAREDAANIPDEAAIASAISRRRRAAGLGQGDTTTGDLGTDADYVSLSADTSRLAVYDPSALPRGPHPESRLQRESDSEGSGDESLAAFTGSKDRLGLKKGLGKAVGDEANVEHARRMRREMRDAVEDGELGLGEGDEDEERWEVEQVRRAGAGYEPAAQEKASTSYTSAKIPAVRPLPTTTSATTRLTTSLSYLLSGQAATETQIAANARERERLEEQEQDVRREVERVEGKREWMQEFVGWIELLGGFLEDKVPVLEKIESDGAHHWSQRRDMIARRRRDDDADDVALFLGVPASVEGVEEVDEMGRTRRDDVGPHASVRRYRREARATRRHARRARATQPSGETSDGYSTDSSLSSTDASDYAAAQTALRQRANALDDDVKAEEFLHPERGIGRRFAEWREREEEEYQAAFGGLGCVQGWEYWARKEMVGWEPSRSNRSVDSFEWFHSLHAYSHPTRPRQPDEMDTSDGEDEEPPLAPEGDMASAMVASLVTRLVERAVSAGEYDVYSMRQTRRLGDLADLISGYTGKEAQKYKAMLRAVLTAFLDESQALSTLVSSALQPTATPPPAFDPASRDALKAFINRRLKLVKNMLIWRRYVPEDIGQLVGVVLGQVVRPSLSRCWDSGGKELASKVLQAVPENILSVDLVAFFKPAR